MAEKKKKQNNISIVLPFEEVSLCPEIFSPPRDTGGAGQDSFFLILDAW